MHQDSYKYFIKFSYNIIVNFLSVYQIRVSGDVSTNSYSHGNGPRVTIKKAIVPEISPSSPLPTTFSVPPPLFSLPLTLSPSSLSHLPPSIQLSYLESLDDIASD